MELRHLDTLLAIERTGSFTAAADLLHTVQSNVSDMVRQLEVELGVPLLVRGRRGAEPTEFGRLLLDRARRIRSEVDALHQDISMVRGLEAGRATLGVVGTISRRIVPGIVADLRRHASGVHLRVNEGASERLAAEVAGRELAQAVVTEPVDDARLVVEHLLEEDMIAVVPRDARIGDAPITVAQLGGARMILPPRGNPLRDEIDLALHAANVDFEVPVEIEGIRLIADLVAAGEGITIIPDMAMPVEEPRLRAIPIADMPPRRLALVSARGSQLSLADQAVRASIVRLLQDVGDGAQRAGAKRVPSTS